MNSERSIADRLAICVRRVPSVARHRLPEQAVMTTVPQSPSAAGDREALQRLDQFGGPVLAERMVRLFLTETPKRLDAATAALQVGDIATVKQIGHMLRSSCGQLGAPTMQALALQMESSEGPEAIAACLGQLRTEFTNYGAWLTAPASPGETSP
jgi:HPt (histidine-containing phosphotransfer) domain-containing protein